MPARGHNFRAIKGAPAQRSGLRGAECDMSENLGRARKTGLHQTCEAQQYRGPGSERGQIPRRHI